MPATRYQPLFAAIVRQAVHDLTNPKLAIRLDAALFFAGGEYDTYAEVLGLSDRDGLELLRTGRIRPVIEEERREYRNQLVRDWRRSREG